MKYYKREACRKRDKKQEGLKIMHEVLQQRRMQEDKEKVSKEHERKVGSGTKRSIQEEGKEM